MTAVMSSESILEAPAGLLEGSEEPEEDDICHISCHCTEHLISYCKLYVGDHEFFSGEYDDSSVVWCPLCSLVWENPLENCPWGCSCPDMCGLPDE